MKKEKLHPSAWARNAEPHGGLRMLLLEKNDKVTHAIPITHDSVTAPTERGRKVGGREPWKHAPPRWHGLVGRQVGSNIDPGRFG